LLQRLTTQLTSILLKGMAPDTNPADTDGRDALLRSFTHCIRAFNAVGRVEVAETLLTSSVIDPIIRFYPLF
jgi:hypothetical protein